MERTSRRSIAERWYDSDESEVGSAAWQVAMDLRDDQAFRLSKCQEYLAIYEGESSVIGNAFDGQYNAKTLVMNVSRSAVDTIHSEIAGRQKPMAKFMTNGGDWKTKRRAVKMEKFCYSALQQRYGQYLNAWELMETVFRDSPVFGAGVVKVTWSEQKKKFKLHLERVYDFELFVDQTEARYGAPSSLFQLHLMDKDVALWKFARDPALELSDEARKSIEMAIDRNEGADLDAVYLHGSKMARATEMIIVVEAWHLAIGDKPGRHVIGVDGATLLDEEWERDTFPFVRIPWAHNLIGWNCKGLVEECEAIQLELNENTDRLQERFRLCSSRRTYYEEGSIDEKYLQQNEAEVLIPVAKGSQIPQEVNPNPISEAEWRYFEGLFSKYFELSGVSQMRASARKEPGVTAGVAIRTINDMQTARFSLKAKAYENAYVDLAKQIVECAKEASKAKLDVRIQYEEEVDWGDVDLCELPEISIAPTSSLPNDLPGRMQMATELFQMQLITGDTFKQMLAWPDLEKESNFQTSQRRYIEKLIDTFLDEGETDESVYVDPDEHLIDDVGATVQVAQAYFDALYNDAPESCLKLIRRYLVALDAKVQAKQAKMAIMQQQMAAQAAPQQPPMQ